MSPPFLDETTSTGDLNARVDALEDAIRRIIERNLRVETEKAWETSSYRIGSLAAFTYLLVSLAFWALGNEKFYLNSIVPTIGFILSTWSLPMLKRRWIQKRKRSGVEG
ncbi:MAG: hypothetical protein K1X83_05940 [Oligoflexia bacterium]|nr:hypothetical protein [Oligoflexia bacterium]